ncbi:MAG: 1-(5-phosphoribosyl)-5-[(5-phosphoribosylamino)methylideneamino]imidazole-4-carboxamide isomerase [Acidobacteriota bacterium]|nr:MAG: 1-(5-phosphoribosyl)-5-[(5-phosphoribosylamino)methylideneamino]imidazole-4-carboxamide isomerase [Acidobacteriota bacterium]
MLIIPAIDLMDGECVRLYKGDYQQRTTYAPDPVEQALRFEETGFRRIHVIDLDGARAGSGQNRQAIRRVIEACRVPVQVGGGIRGIRDVEELFEWGAQYLILGTIALERPGEVDQWVKRYGGEPFIVSLDLRKGRLQTEGWLEESNRSLEDAVSAIARWGMREVICTDVDRDGTLEQPNWTTYNHLLDLLSDEQSLIAAGGVSAPEHIQELKELGVDGAVVGRALYEGDFSWEELLGAG